MSNNTMPRDPLGYCNYWIQKVDWKLTVYTESLLLQIVGDTGENEGGDDLIQRLAIEHLTARGKYYD